MLISCVGFETKKINVTLPKDKEITVDLKPIPIELPEVIIDADENPAYAIIRKAIANKEKNKKGLQNYYYDFYSKNILKSGSEIVFVEEDIGEGLIILNEEVREIKTKLHKTENISIGGFEFFRERNNRFYRRLFNIRRVCFSPTAFN